jgi:glyoxylase-like metal-dependent hydrolase (beta-lactamase superfamily II)
MEFEKIYQGNLVEIFRISDYFYFRKADLPVRGQCNGAFIVGETGVAIVDATPGGIEMADESEKLFNKPVTAICLTHGHGDHIDGLKDWLDRDITVYCSRRVIEGLDPSFFKRRVNFVGIEGPVQLRLAGNVKVDLIPNNDVAHSKWDTFIRIPSVGVVCTGDSVVEYQTAYFHSADIRSWILSLRRLAKEKGTWVLAGHGETLFSYSYINEFADYLAVIERCAQICLQRRWPNPSETADPRFVDLTSADVRGEVEKLFAEKGEDTRSLEERAGPEDARREVRMVLWAMVRMYIR